MLSSMNVEEDGGRLINHKDLKNYYIALAFEVEHKILWKMYGMYEMIAHKEHALI